MLARNATVVNNLTSFMSYVNALTHTKVPLLWNSPAEVHLWGCPRLCVLLACKGYTHHQKERKALTLKMHPAPFSHWGVMDMFYHN